MKDYDKFKQKYIGKISRLEKENINKLKTVDIK